MVRALQRDYANPPDVAAFPETEGDVVDLLDWCAGIGAAAIPYGGGSSVVGGVESPSDGAYRDAATIDLRHEWALS